MSNAAMAWALVQLAREAHGAEIPLGEVGNILVALSVHFVQKKSKEQLPDLPPALRQEILELALNRQAVADQRMVVPLVSWLRQEPIPAIPAPKTEILQGEKRDPAADRDHTAEHKKSPVSETGTKKRRDDATDRDVKPTARSNDWLIVAGILVGLAVLVGLGLVLLRRRVPPQ